MRHRLKQTITATLITASLLTPFGCNRPLHGADMGKPITRQEEPDVKAERRTLDAVPVIQKKEVTEETKTEKPKHPILKLKEPKEPASPKLEFK